ncbi:MAG: hypothetical protein PUG67_02570 [Peptoniphilaceae bacterium]|nr:hypothetical protein [Peptoniphilaceae bacterium]MDY6018919.1 hypothetical protein [Anaerococcus sp.]
MKIKNISLLVAFSLALVSCKQISSSNVNTKDTNLVLDDYEKDKKPKKDFLSTDDKDISSILNKDNNQNKENSTKEIDIEAWKKKLVDIGQFNKDFVDGLAKDRIRDLVKKAQDLSDKTGYWDVKDFVFQELSKAFPDQSNKFPLASIDEIYDWEISDDDKGVDKYQSERKYLVNEGLDSNLAYQITNSDLKKAFRKTYEENEDYYYEDYIKAVVNMYSKENNGKNTDNNNNNNEGNVKAMYDNEALYDQLKKDMVEQYGFDPDVVAKIPNKDIDIANARAQKRLEETGFGDIGLVFDEIGKMYPGSSTMYPGN